MLWEKSKGGQKEQFFFFQAEDGIRDIGVTGVQTCALPILIVQPRVARLPEPAVTLGPLGDLPERCRLELAGAPLGIGRASGRERVVILGGAVSFKKKHYYIDHLFSTLYSFYSIHLLFTYRC